MKTTKLTLLLFAVAAFLSSCGEKENDPVLKERTQSNIQNAEIVGTLPDGRVVKVFQRVRGGIKYSHYVYFIENGDGKSSTISTNSSVQNGKTTRNETTVLIDGTKYVPLENQ